MASNANATGDYTDTKTNLTAAAIAKLARKLRKLEKRSRKTEKSCRNLRAQLSALQAQRISTAANGNPTKQIIPAVAGSPSHLLRLPVELLERIAGFTWTATYYNKDAYGGLVRRAAPEHFKEGEYVHRIPPNAHLGLRFVCRTLNDATFRLFADVFFKELTVIFSHSSLQRLIDVSRHPVLSHVPRALKIGTHQLPSVGDIRDMSSPEADSMFRDSTVLQMLLADGILSDIPCNTGFLQEARGASERYRATTAVQDALRDSDLDSSMLATALQNFVCVTKVGVEAASCDRLFGNICTCHGPMHWGARHLAEMTGLAHVNALLQPALRPSLKNNTTSATQKLLAAISMIDPRRTVRGWRGVEDLDLKGQSSKYGQQPEEYEGLTIHELSTVGLLTRRSGPATLESLKRLSLTVDPYILADEDPDEEEMHEVLEKLAGTSLEGFELKILPFNQEVLSQGVQIYIDELLFELIEDYMYTHSPLRDVRLSISCSVHPAVLRKYFAHDFWDLEKIHMEISDTQGNFDYSLPWLDIIGTWSNCDNLRDLKFTIVTPSNRHELCSWDTREEVKAGLADLMSLGKSFLMPPPKDDE